MEDKNKLLQLIYSNTIDETFIKKITYNEIEFQYFDIDTINTIIQGDTDEIKKIFKLNFGLICKELQLKYPDINININLDTSNYNELRIKGELAFKHNVYLSFEYNDKLYECGFDFIEKNENYEENKDINNIYLYDMQKHVSCKVNVDYYDEYYEYISDDMYDKYYEYIKKHTFDDIAFQYIDKHNKSNQKYEYFIENVIYRILIILAAITEDEYKLAEILFVKANKDSEDIMINLGCFEEILNIKKNNTCDLNKLYIELLMQNPKTGKRYNFEEFINYITKQYKKYYIKDIIIFENNINYDTYFKLINCIDINTSTTIMHYKLTIENVMNTLMISLKTINDLLMQINKTKRYIPEYIDSILVKMN